MDLGGEETAKPKPGTGDANPDAPTEEPATLTSTIIKSINSNDPAGKLCFQRGELLGLPTLETVITADGDLQDWGDATFQVSDPGGDTQLFDIHQVAVALVKHDSTSELGLALKGDDFSQWNSSNLNANIRFGSLLRDESNNGKTEFKYLREYRITKTGVQKLVNGAYVNVAPDTFSYSVASSGFMEILIKKSELDEVLLQPLWSVEIEVTGSTSGDLEKTGRYFFKNVLSYPTGFSTNLCLFRMGSQTVTIQEIVDESLFESEEENYLESERDIKKKRIEKLLSIVRQSIETSWILLGKPVTQFSHHAVVFSEDTEDLSGQTLESEALLHLKMTETSKLNPFYSKLVYERAGEYLVRTYVDHQLVLSKPYLQLFVANMLSQLVHENQLGIKYWLETYQRKINSFYSLNDAEEPAGLEEWQMRYDAGGLNEDAKDYLIAKTAALALILFKHVPPNILISSLRTLKEDYSNQGLTVEYEDLFARLDSNLQGTFLANVTPYYPGWLENGSYLEAHSPFLLSDEDLDGLPRFMEQTIGTNPGREDTDRDGWTDLSEVYALSDPKSTSSRPNGIMADGSFGDWQELLPDLVNNDNGSNSAGCPAAADISHYAAIYDNGRLIFAAAGKDIWAEPPYVRWEVQVSITTSLEAKTFTLRTVKNRYNYDVLEGPDRKIVLRYPSAKPLGIDSMEWELELDSVGVDYQSITPENFGVTYRISTLYEDEERILCDDTPWAKPLYSTIEN